MTVQEIVLRQLEQAGFAGASVEAQEQLLIIKLRPQDRGRLLADAALRESLAREAQQAGFSRVSLEIG